MKPLLKQKPTQTTGLPQIVRGLDGNTYERIIQAGHCAIDFETTSLDWWNPDEYAWWVAISCDGLVNVCRVDEPKVWQLLLRLLRTDDLLIIGAHIKFDVHWVRVLPDNEIIKALLVDICVEGHLINENKPNGLKPQTHRHFGVELREFLGVLGWKTIQVPDKRTKNKTRKKKIRRHITEVPEKEVVKYVAEDAFYAEALHFEVLQPILQRSPNLNKNFWDIQVPLTKVLWAMERRGVQVNVKGAKELEKQLLDEATTEERELKRQLRRRGIPVGSLNLGSPKQVDNLLYNDLKLQRPPIQVFTKNKDGERKQSKFHTNELCLIWVGVELGETVAQQIISIRKKRKIVSTFLNAIITKSVDERLHTTFNQSVARTGRLSSSSPCNLQNIPRDSRVRTLFISQKGKSLLIADLGQAELRFLGHFSQDPALLSAYHNPDTDLHRDTADSVGLIAILGEKDGRFAGKTGNFSVVYGVGPNTFRYMLYKETNGRIRLSLVDATDAVQRIEHDRFSGVSQWKARLLSKARPTQIVYTIENRQRRLPGLASSNWGSRGYAERQAVNAVVQGSVGDAINRIMASFIYKICLKYQVLQVHDEIVLEATEAELSTIQSEVERIPSRIVDYYNLTVPMEMDYNITEVWEK